MSGYRGVEFVYDKTALQGWFARGFFYVSDQIFPCTHPNGPLMVRRVRDKRKWKYLGKKCKRCGKPCPYTPAWKICPLCGSEEMNNNYEPYWTYKLSKPIRLKWLEWFSTWDDINHDIKLRRSKRRRHYIYEVPIIRDSRKENVIRPRLPRNMDFEVVNEKSCDWLPGQSVNIKVNKRGHEYLKDRYYAKRIS
ncbi:MAG: hypothetical protein GF317_14280 [Candidatus Lokiarchaeota archaeon]|nr:hypothetical protein [Candidatus Lokiarchaeota archaeon]